MTESKILPVLPLRDIVVFPHMVVPLFVGREKSVKALDEIMKGEKQILLATQKNSVDDDPSPDAIYPVGVLASVLYSAHIGSFTLSAYKMPDHIASPASRFLEPWLGTTRLPFRPPRATYAPISCGSSSSGGRPPPSMNSASAIAGRRRPCRSARSRRRA